MPITNMIEDIMEKKSSESYFIQIADFVSYFVHLYFETRIRADVPYDEPGFTEDVCNSIDRDLGELLFRAHKYEYDIQYRYCGF